MSSSSPLPSVHTRTTLRPAPGGMGTGLFATSDISPGQDVLHIKTPFVAVLDTPRLEDTCSGCFGRKQMEETKKLRACTGCRIVRYCDKACQAKDWKFAHSLECSIFANLRPRILPNSVRAVLRIVLRHDRQKYDSREFDMFLKLETHAREIRDQNSEQWERILLSAKAVKEYSGTDLKEETIATFFAKLDINSFNLTTPFYDRIGLYAHPFAALINHSCDYNCVTGFDGDELFMKAIRPIKADEQIFISYVDTSNPYKDRRKELARRYYFDCQCSRCQREASSPEEQALARPIDVSAAEAAEGKAKELMASATTDDVPSRSVAKLKSAIHMLHKTSACPITRQPYVSLRDELIVSLLSAQQFQSAFAQAVIRYLRVDPVIYPQFAHPIRQLHVWALAKLAIHISQGVENHTEDPVSLQKLELNFGLIIWSLLARLVKGEREACTVPRFQEMVRAAYNEVHGEFIANGLDPAMMTEDIKKEWEKLEGLADEALQDASFGEQA
ncbi:hypothetical protein VTN02DRAFT_2027 [Thermoascus thermophilus]